jgi:hypothetical protein
VTERVRGQGMRFADRRIMVKRGHMPFVPSLPIRKVPIPKALESSATGFGLRKRRGGKKGFNLSRFPHGRLIVESICYVWVRLLDHGRKTGDWR